METKRIIKITNPKTILKKPKENKKKPTIFLKRFSKITKKNLNLNLKNTKNKRNKKNWKKKGGGRGGEETRLTKKFKPQKFIKTHLK